MAESKEISEKEAVEVANHNHEVEHHDPLHHNPYYFRSFWGAFKASTKGVLGGLIIGATVGALAGLAAGPLFFLFIPAVAELGLGTAIAASTGLFSALGMGIGAHKFTDAGNIAGASAATAEMQEARIFEGVSQMLSRALGKDVTPPCPIDIDFNVGLSPDAPHLTDNPHYESTSSKNGKWFHWKIGIAGILVGLGVGALIAFAAAPAATTIAGFLLTGTAHSAVTLASHAIAAHAGATMLATGLLGGSFGIERNLFRKVFDVTDNIFAGNFLTRHKNQTVVPQPQYCFTREPISKNRPVNAYASREELAAFADPRQGGASGKSWQERVPQRQAVEIKPRPASALEAYQQEQLAKSLTAPGVVR